MHFHKRFTVLPLLLFLVPTAMAGQVITWVAPYKMAPALEMLQKDFGGVGMKDGLTYLALQFWKTNGPNLTRDPGVEMTGFDDNVKEFRDWGHANGVKVTLCVTDFVGDWNWPEAVRSFNANRAAFISSLVAEMDRLELDGVELDLEGIGTPTMGETNGYIAFAVDLGTALHAKGKTLTAASFPAQWNAPNWTMWPKLMQSVDAVTSMGYETTGMNSTNGYNYSDQKKHAIPPGKLMIGMPGYKDAWEGNTALEQLDWVIADGTVGVGIWDCGLDSPAWQTAAVWKKLAKIRSTVSIGIVYGNRKPILPAKGMAGARIYDLTGERLSLPGIGEPADGLRPFRKLFFR